MFCFEENVLLTWCGNCFLSIFVLNLCFSNENASGSSDSDTD